MYFKVKISPKLHIKRFNFNFLHVTKCFGLYRVNRVGNRPSLWSQLHDFGRNRVQKHANVRTKKSPQGFPLGVSNQLNP